MPSGTTDRGPRVGGERASSRRRDEAADLAGAECVAPEPQLVVRRVDEENVEAVRQDAHQLLHEHASKDRSICVGVDDVQLVEDVDVSHGVLERLLDELLHVTIRVEGLEADAHEELAAERRRGADVRHALRFEPSEVHVEEGADPVVVADKLGQVAIERASRPTLARLRERIVERQPESVAFGGEGDHRHRRPVPTWRRSSTASRGSIAAPTAVLMDASVSRARARVKGALARSRRRSRVAALRPAGQTVGHGVAP